MLDNECDVLRTTPVRGIRRGNRDEIMQVDKQPPVA